jgi:hypothetical protein
MGDEQNSTEEPRESPMKAPLNWRADAEVFDDALINFMRVNDRASVIVLLDEISRDAATLLSADAEVAQEEWGAMLDRLACVAAAAIRFREPTLFDSCAGTAFSVYMAGFDEDGNQRISARAVRPVSSPLLWLEIARRIVAVGGLAVRRGDWRAVRHLALHVTTDRGSVSSGYTQYWLRHAITEAARAGLFTDRKARSEEGSLVAAAAALVDRESCLRPDLPAGDYRLLHSLLGFDLLASLVVSADAGDFNTDYVYPDFIYWNLYHVEPLLTRLLRDEGMRGELFPVGMENALLARALRTLSEMARQGNSGWSRWGGHRVLDFLSQNPEAGKSKIQ